MSAYNPLMSAHTATPAQVPLSGVPEGTKQTTRFMQDRLALFAMVGSAISSAFLVKVVAAYWLGGETLAECVGKPSMVTHVAGTLILVSIWLLARRRAEMRPASLAALDVLGLVAATSAFTIMVADSAKLQPLAAGNHAILTAGVLLMARAIIVPTRTRAAIWINALGFAPVLVLAWFIAQWHPQFTFTSTLADTAIWCVAFVVLATIASRVLHGLRERVREARQLGQYTLVDKIGSGGMGNVFRATHAMLRRPTAIKLLRPERVTDRQLARFEREVQLTAQLTHPNTIGIFDYGRTPDGIFYYAMEYLDGVDLEVLVNDDGPQPAARVIHILRQVCGALAEAHAAGLIHRDVKPANIFLCERGGEGDVVKVLDFGLVKDSSDGEDAKLSIDHNVVTGTPLYMAPEAIRDPDIVDARTDLYALGAVAYFLLAGEPVFSGETVVEVCAAHLHDEPPPLAERCAEEVPAELEAAIMGCLKKDPVERPRDAETLRDMLDSCGRAHPWDQTRARAWWSGRLVAAPISSGTGAVNTVDIDLQGRVAAAG